jgi:predicted ester cyclase
VTDDELASFYRRYNACCNEHRFDELGEFVSRDVVINGTDRGLDAYAEGLASVVRAFPDYRWELRRLVVDAPWIAAHLADTGTHRATFCGVEATGRAVGIPEFAFYPRRRRPDRRGVGRGLPRAPPRAAPVARAR